MKSLSHYRAKLHDRGFREIILGRLRWYKRSFAMDNWVVGRLVELFGNRISLDGITLSLANPLIPTPYKSNIYFGIYENGERELSAKYLNRNIPTVEIGGSIGGVSCTVSKLLKDPASYVVVECSPENLLTLTKNRDLNQCSFAIEPKALAYGSDTISFNLENFIAGRVNGNSVGKVWSQRQH